MNKQQILANLDYALALIEATPDSAIDLSKYRQQRNCQTLHCTAGVLAEDPYFQSLGWGWLPSTKWPEERSMDVVRIDHQHIANSPKLEEQFGPRAIGVLFDPRRTGRYDTSLLLEREVMSDKGLAIARIRKQIEIVEALP